MVISQSILKKVALILLFLVGIVLSMKSIKEPDLWWQLRTGEWILENERVPKQDVFSFSYEGVEWINVKWGYEVLMAGTESIGGPAFIPVLQIIITILLLLLLLKSINLIGQNLISKDFSISTGSIFILLMFLWIIDIRMTGRPEAVSHLFAAAYIYFFTRYRFSPSNLIFIIIVLQILWTNLHEAYGMGMVLAVIFTFGLWLDYFFFNKNKIALSIPVKASIATFLLIISAAVNPRGVDMILHPFEIYSQLGENKFTTELFSFTSDQYWDYRAYFAVLIFIIAAIVIFFNLNIKKGSNFQFLRSFGAGYLLVFLSLIYLSFSAHRNIPFGLIAAVPIVAAGADKWLNTKTQYLPTATIFVTLFGIIFYIGVITNKYYEIFNPRDNFGLEVNVAKTPYNAAKFIEENNIKGRAFTDFLSSSYLLWHLQPHFNTYIDLRDLDIFPAVFFKNNFLLYQNPQQVFPLADSDMQFDYVELLNDQLFQQLHRYLLQSGEFTLVYGDILSSVYVKNTPTNKEVILKYGSGDVFQKLKPFPNHPLPKLLTLIFNPFYKFNDYENLDYNGFRTAYYNYLGVQIN